MKVVFHALNQPAHLDGVWRYPGESAQLHRDLAEEYILRGIARTAPDRLPSGSPTPRAVASQPRLFVVIPTRGRPEDLDRTLAATFFEPPTPINVVVVCDGDIPETASVLENWKKRQNGSLRVVEQSRLGVNRARMAGIDLLPDDAVVVEVDDHDPPEPGALRRVIDVFRNGDVQAAYGDYLAADEKGRLVRRVTKPDYSPQIFLEGNHAVGLRAYRKSAYLSVGGYREEEQPSGDYGLWLRFDLTFGSAGIVRIPTPLCRVTFRSGSISVRHAPEQAEMAEKLRRRAATGTLVPDQKKAQPDPPLPDFSNVLAELIGEKPPQAKVGIVVPCRHSRDYAFPLAEALHDCGCAVVFVSDGDGRYPIDHCQVVLSENTGFAHAVNVGAQHCDAEYLWLLNADIKLPETDVLGPMVKILDVNPDVAIVGNRHMNSNGTINSIGSEFSYATGAVEHIGRNLRNHPDKDKQKELDFITFACVLIRKSVWDEIGGLDERYRRAY